MCIHDFTRIDKGTYTMLNSSRDTTEGARRSIGRGEGRGVCLLCDPDLSTTRKRKDVDKQPKIFGPRRYTCRWDGQKKKVNRNNFCSCCCSQLPIHPSIHLSASDAIYPSMHPCIHPSIHPSIVFNKIYFHGKDCW